MPPDVIFVISILQLFEAADIFLNTESDDSNNVDDDLSVILNFVRVIPFILQIFQEGYELTKDLSRENDAYKIIRYVAEYRYMIKYVIDTIFDM